MTETRRHPDVFTADEAVEYLHLDPGKHTHVLETLRDAGLLTGWKPGKEYLYHRSELDAAVTAGFSFLFDSVRRAKIEPTTGPRLRMAGGSSK